ncbi:ankyrin repeat and kinase domain containing 1 [Seminavis robusta]|uniref:Ankyrin repeat and kinase domain containing 1 n=1 Tax=Seminavis robusta TaxID=568900 RepID=A0A9N8DM11_9STRA|nr:ankyrin repeat and kinase domain containing 1 [Seminavis robusta]|eukprot:Sro155_g070550.1 ankyrin repeat and kinase domain containing 1 (301) ;mRNA; r:95410-96312
MPVSSYPHPKPTPNSPPSRQTDFEINRALFWAARVGDHDTIAALPRIANRSCYGCSWDPVNEAGWTPLCLAAKSTGPRALSTVRLLVERGANVYRRTCGGMSPLSIAILFGSCDTAKFLVGRTEQNIIAASSMGKLGRCTKKLSSCLSTMVQLAVSTEDEARDQWTELARELVTRGATVDTFDADKNTPLIAALCHQHYPLARFLVQQGASVNRHKRGRREGFPLSYAVQDGRWKLFALLLQKGASPARVTQKMILQSGTNVFRDRTKDGWSPLELAAASGSLHLIFVMVFAHVMVEGKI